MEAQSFEIENSLDAFYLSKNVRKAFGRLKMVKEQRTPYADAPTTRWGRRHRRHLHYWDPQIIAEKMLRRGKKVMFHHYYTPDQRIHKLVMKTGKDAVWAVKLFLEEGRFLMIEDKTIEAMCGRC